MIMTPNLRAHRTCSLAFLALLLVACGREQAPEPVAVEAPEAAPARARPEGATSAPNERLYDEEGRLMPSDEFLAGLRLPRGMQFFRQDNLESVYRTELPLKDILAYFGPLLTTGKVDRIGEGAIYRHATVRGAEMNPTKVEVSILPAGKLTRVAILKIPPPSKDAPPASETKAAYYKQVRSLD